MKGIFLHFDSRREFGRVGIKLAVFCLFFGNIGFSVSLIVRYYDIGLVVCGAILNYPAVLDIFESEYSLFLK